MIWGRFRVKYNTNIVGLNTPCLLNFIYWKFDMIYWKQMV